MRSLAIRLVALSILLIPSTVYAHSVTISGTQSFASLDGSSSDHDGVANGVFTVSDGDLVVSGVVNCNDDGAGDSACAMSFAVSGNMSVINGGALYAENRSGSGSGGAIALTVGGNLSLAGNAIISTASKSSSGSLGGAITANVAGNVSTSAGTAIDSGSANARGGAITVSSSGAISIDGNVLSGPSRTLLATRLYGGAALDGGTANSIGGSITIGSTTFLEPGLTVGPNANIVSQGADGGSGPVTLDGCGIVVNGLVAALSRKDGTGSVRIRSGKDVVIDGRDLGVTGGTRLGRVRADATSGTAVNKGVDVFATETIQLLGPATGTHFLLTSVPGLHDSKSYGGTMRVVSVTDGVIASGNVIDAGHTATGDTGGTIDLSAKADVNLDTADIRAVGDFNTNNPNRGGGAIRVRSYSGNVIWTNGSGEVRPVGSTSNLPLADQGSIVLTACGTVNTTGSSFPVMGSATSVFPETHTGVCTPAAPSLPTGVPPLVVCNTPPVANDVVATTNEDNSVTITLSGSDADGDPLTFTIVSGPANGSLGPVISTGPTTATVTYSPNLNYNGSDSFVYRAHDGNGGTDDANATITIVPVNDPPSFLAGPTKVVLEDAGPQSFVNWATGISPGPADESGQSVTFTVTNSNPSLFTVQPAVAPNGTLTFTSAPHANGSASLTVVAQDNGGTANGGNDTSAAQSSAITVTPVNDAPSFVKGADQSAGEDAGAQTVIGWATGISAGPNEGSQTVSFVVAAATPALFSVQPAVDANGNLTYTPAPDANGSTSVSIYAQDNGGTANGGVDTSAPQTFNISMSAVNDAPSFVKGADQTVDEDAGAQTVNPWATSISAGPADESGQNVHFLVTGNTNTALFAVAPAVAPDGTLTYTPAANTSGSATITVIIKDDGGTAGGGVDTSASQTFVITVNAINDEPSFTAGGDVTVNEDSAAYSAAWATAISAGPNETQTLTFVITNSNAGLFASGPSIASDGTLSFTLAANANGSASLSVVLQDDGGTANGGDDTSDAAAFTITVNAVNDAPTFAGSGNVSVLEDSGSYSATWATAISAGPANESGQSVTFVVSATNLSIFASAPAINAAGVLTFTLNADAFGSSTVTVTAKDDGGTANGGSDTSAPQSFSINAGAVNDAPSFTAGGNVSANEDAGPYSAAWASAISAGPANESGQALTFVVSSTNPALFSAAPQISPAGVLTFTSAPNAFGQSTVTVYLQDNGGTANGGVNVSGTVTFTITINDTNEPPNANNDAFETIGNTLLEVSGAASQSPAVYVSGSLLTNDTDDDPLTASLVSATSGAVVTVNGDGTFTYVPPPGLTGTTDTFTYQVSDGSSTDTATVTITIKNRVWYVKNNGGGSTGTSASPFTTLTAAETASSAGDTVFVFTGDGTTGGQNSGFSFKSNQRLIGEGVALKVAVSVNGGANPTQLHAAGSRANIGNAAAIGVLASNDGSIEVAGVNISAATDGISVTVGITATGLTLLHDLDVVSAGSRGIVLTGAGNNTATVNNVNVASTGHGLEVRGPHFLTITNDSFTATGGNGVDIDFSTGAPIVMAFSNISIGGATSGDGIRFGTATLDTIPGASLNVVNAGTVTIGTAGNPVGGNGLVLNNTTGHLSVASLSSYSAGSAAFVVGAGTFTGAAGTQLSTATGVLSSNGNSAVNASNSTLGLTLASVSSTGSASYGISLASVDGTINVASGSIANAATADVTVSGSDVAFTYGGTISDDLGSLVTIASSQGTYNFSGAITDLNNGSGNGISLTGNTGATISFTGGTVLSTGANAAFTATGGGTVNVSGTNTVTTSTGTAVRIVSTTIGGAGVKFDSVSSNGGANSAIVLDTTGAGTFTAGGGTIANKSVDAITLSNTDGPVVLESMILEDIGSMAGGFHVNSGHDAIHGQQVRGGLTLDGVTIRRISDNAVNGSVFGNITGATVWNGLTIVNSTIEDTNRFHVSGVGDANNEGAVRILGISGTVSITNSTLRRGAELIDFFAGSGTLNLTATNNQFHQAYKEFTSGTTASVGNHCFDVTLQAGVNANITVGDRSNVALANDFLNCRAGSVRVANDPGATGHANVTIGRNTFAVNDHSSGFGGDFDFPMGGVAMIGLSSAATWDVVVDANHFDEATNASGANGQFSLMMQGGTWQVLAEDNVFDTPGNAPWYVRADGASTSSKVLFRNNTGVQGFFNCPDASCGGGYNGPGLRSVADVQNGGALQLTIDGDDFAAHDTFFDPGPTVTARILAVGAPGTLCLNLQNNAAPDGYGLERYAGTFNLYQPSGSGTCPPNSVCQLALAANGNSGGAGNGATLPPAVTVAGTINIVPTACAIPTGGIF